MQLVSAKQSGETEDEIKKTLLDNVALQAYFGKDGEWRKAIIKKRTLEEFKKLLHVKLVNSMKLENKDSKVIDIYKSLLGFFEDVIVGIAQDPVKNMLTYDFSDDSIIEELQKVTEKFNENNDELIAQLAHPELIKAYFDFDKMRKEALSEEGALHVSALVDQAVAQAGREIDFTGEWLNEGEVEYLWRYEKEESVNPVMKRYIPCTFNAIADYSLLDAFGQTQETATQKSTRVPLSNVVITIKDDIKNNLSLKKDFFNIIAMGTMKHDGTTRGHWYPVVRHQTKNGDVRYYVMDSQNNNNRTQDPNVLKLMDSIDK